MEILRDSISSADPIGTTLPGCHQHLCALLSELPESKSCSGAGAPPALCSQPGDLIPCLVLSLGRLLWCTEQGLHDLCPDEVLTPIVPTVTVTSF